MGELAINYFISQEIGCNDMRHPSLKPIEAQAPEVYRSKCLLEEPKNEKNADQLLNRGIMQYGLVFYSPVICLIFFSIIL